MGKINDMDGLKVFLENYKEYEEEIEPFIEDDETVKVGTVLSSELAPEDEYLVVTYIAGERKYGMVITLNEGEFELETTHYNVTSDSLDFGISIVSQDALEFIEENEVSEVEEKVEEVKAKLEELREFGDVNYITEPKFETDCCNDIIMTIKADVGELL